MFLLVFSLQVWRKKFHTVWIHKYCLLNCHPDKLLFLIYSGNAACTKSAVSYSCSADVLDHWKQVNKHFTIYSAKKPVWSVVLVGGQLCRASANAAWIKSPNSKCRLCAKYLLLFTLFSTCAVYCTHALIQRKSISYRLICPVDPDQEQWLSDE